MLRHFRLPAMFGIVGIIRSALSVTSVASGASPPVATCLTQPSTNSIQAVGSCPPGAQPPIVGFATSGGVFYSTTAQGIVYNDGYPVPGLSGQPLAAPIVGIASGPGHWLVAKDGGVFAFDGAPFAGSMGGQGLNAPIVGMAPTSDG
jgi:hypothetical protein